MYRLDDSRSLFHVHVSNNFSPAGLHFLLQCVDDLTDWLRVPPTRAKSDKMVLLSPLSFNNGKVITFMNVEYMQSIEK